MLEELRIRSVGVIADAHARFHTGLTALTGETGAGKTMVLTGLGLLMGSRSDSSLVRKGEDAAEVEGVLSAVSPSVLEPIAEDVGGILDDGALLMSRTVPREGRARATLAGRAVPAGRLAEVAGEFITVHGQSDQLRLRSSAQQREALDLYADLAGPLAEHRAEYDKWRAAEADLAKWEESAREAAATRRILEAGLAAIDGVAPVAGEDDELRAEAERLANVDELRVILAAAAGALDGEDTGAISQIARTVRSLRDSGRYGDEYLRWSEVLDGALAAISDVASDVAEALGDLDADPQRLEEVHARRAEITTLLRSYGPTIDDALAWAEDARSQLAILEGRGSSREELAVAVEEQRREVVRSAAELTKRRRKAATQLSAKVNGELAALAMKGATFGITVGESEIGPHGGDEIAMTLAPHPGATPLPVAKSASGGELSRIMLALEVSLASPGADHTFVFDEVDAGVGGAAAVEVGRRLAELAKAHQVIVVTHLAQVAAFADRHLVVDKDAGSGPARTELRAVEGEERRAELARMLAGDTSDTALQHAAELMERSQVG